MNLTLRHAAELGGRFMWHAAAVIGGLMLMIVGLAMGVTMVLLPVGLAVGIAGVLLFLLGLFARPERGL